MVDDRVPGISKSVTAGFHCDVRGCTEMAEGASGGRAPECPRHGKKMVKNGEVK